MAVDPKARRHMSKARQELKHAVNRFAAIDPLPGHVAEAKRLAIEVRDEATRLVAALSQPEGDDG